MVAERFATSTVCFHARLSVRRRERRGAAETPTLPPPGDYATSCVGREKAFEYGALTHGTPVRLVRLEYAIDMRYGVLHDVASKVFAGLPVDVSMGHVNLIWQGDANEQALRLLAHCTVPASPLNVSGPDVVSVRWLAAEFGTRFGKTVQVTGMEAPTAWLVDTRAAQALLGPLRVPLARMIDWQADWIARGMPGLGKPTHFETRDGKY